jgi:DNA polymerase III alpha subunit
MLNKKNTLDNLILGILNHGPKVIEYAPSDIDMSDYLERVYKEKLGYPVPKPIDKDNWFIPDDYKNMDIEKFLIDRCPTENYQRLINELDLFRKNQMIIVLQTMKYIVDTLRQNNIVWGVGRGSSVASYALFLLGVHKIDSVKYNLPIEEFFKGEQNG